MACAGDINYFYSWHISALSQANTCTQQPVRRIVSLGGNINMSQHTMGRYKDTSTHSSLEWTQHMSRVQHIQRIDTGEGTHL